MAVRGLTGHLEGCQEVVYWWRRYDRERMAPWAEVRSVIECVAGCPQEHLQVAIEPGNDSWAGLPASFPE